MTHIRKGLMLASIVSVLVALAGSAALAGMENTPHDFRASRFDQLRKTAGDEICRPCHLPHHANSQMSLFPSYQDLWVATSDTYLKESVMCLSCHDGTIATSFEEGGITQTGHVTLEVNNPNIVSPVTVHDKNNPMTNGEHGRIITQSAGKWVAQNKFTDTKLPLFTQASDPNQPRMACATCHDPHVWQGAPGATFGKFLRTGEPYGEMCITCHPTQSGMQ